jgi:hypothetical protein
LACAHPSLAASRKRGKPNERGEKAGMLTHISRMSSQPSASKLFYSKGTGRFTSASVSKARKSCGAKLAKVTIATIFISLPIVTKFNSHDNSRDELNLPKNMPFQIFCIMAFHFFKLGSRNAICNALARAVAVSG